MTPYRMTGAELKAARLAMGHDGTSGVKAMAEELCISVRHYWRLEAGDREITPQTAKLVEMLLTARKLAR